MRRASVVLPFAAATLALAGCGGSSGPKLADVRPCLSKLGLLVVAKPPTKGPDGRPITVTQPTLDNADIAYRHERVGANAVHMTFYGSKDGANAALMQAKSFAATNPRANFGAERTVLDGSVLVFWSSKPSRAQSRALAACFG
jgi:hypothetical protein